MLFRSADDDQRFAGRSVKPFELIEIGHVQGLIDDGQALGGVQHDVGDSALDELQIEDFPFRVHLCDEAVIVTRVRLPVHIGNKEFLALLVADETARRFQPGNLSRVEQTRGTCKQTPGQCRPQKGAAKCVGG